MNDKLGLLVEIFMSNGVVFRGAIRRWDNNSIMLASPLGEVVEILKPEDICAVVYKKTPEEDVRERDQTSEEPKHKLGDEHSLIELYKMRIKSEREMAQRKIKSSTCSLGEIEYGSSLSALSGIAHDPGRQNKNNKK